MSVERRARQKVLRNGRPPQGQDAMSTTRPEAMTWIEEQARHSSVGSAWGHLTEQAGVVLAEIGGHSGTSMCSTMAEFTNKNMF